MGFAAALLGFLFGFAGSIPAAGPIAMLVASRGLAGRARSALWLGSGAAIAEAGYVYLAFRGFSAVLARYAWVEPASRIAAVATLIGLGVRFACGLGAAPASRPVAPRDARVEGPRSFLLGLAITAFNPALIATWSGALALLFSLDLVRFDPAAALPFALGACAGISAWFAILVGLLGRLRWRVSRGACDRWVRGMGLALIVLGLGFAARFAYRL